MMVDELGDMYSVCFCPVCVCLGRVGVSQRGGHTGFHLLPQPKYSLHPSKILILLVLFESTLASPQRQ